MSDYMLAVRDQLNDKSDYDKIGVVNCIPSVMKLIFFSHTIVLHIFEITPLNTMPTIKHGFSITDVQLMTTKSPEKRYLAMIDSSMNIFIVHMGNKDSSKTYKLGK